MPPHPGSPGEGGVGVEADLGEVLLSWYGEGPPNLLQVVLDYCEQVCGWLAGRAGEGGGGLAGCGEGHAHSGVSAGEG